MTADALLRLLTECPLVASVQASPTAPYGAPATLGRMALASKEQGVRVLRMQGVENIRAAREATELPVVGLIKRDYADSEIYITPTLQEVDELLATGCEIVALDGTARPRPHDENLADLIQRIHQAGRLVLADIDTVESAQYAATAGADLLSTTLAGYTQARKATSGPDLDLLREVVQATHKPILAEGRFDAPWQLETALRIGARGVVIGGALNDVEKNTRRFLPSPHATEPVGAVDIGGTWLRFGSFTPDWQLIDSERTPNPPKREERIAWIRQRIAEAGVKRVGLSTGGITDPRTGEVWTAKEYLMPDHIGIHFDEANLGVPVYAHGDGHATAWAHACLPRFAGKRVATLALGTGVGCGFVFDNKIWSGRRGEYPRVNDLPAPGGHTYEDLLGGFHLTREPSEQQKAAAVVALESALKAIRDFYFPDEVVIAGSVGMSDLLRPHVEEDGAVVSPFGSDAGLYGAAALALFPNYL